MELFINDASSNTDEKSLENLAFVHWLRTGQCLSANELEALIERKYNHNHDELGRFASSMGGPNTHSAIFHSPPPRPADRSSRAPAPTHHQSPTPNRRTSAPPAAPARQTTRSSHAPDPKSHGVLQRDGYTSWTQVGSHPARAYRTKSGVTIIDPRSVMPMLVPEGVSIGDTAKLGRDHRIVGVREPLAAGAFAPGGPMDFQRTYSTLRDKHGAVMIDQRFIAIGNYNFGVYAAASGMPLTEAMVGANVLFRADTHGRSGNSRNERLIASGYRDFVRNNIGH